jgi:TM2 domain-containing membrane protein YozV
MAESVPERNLNDPVVWKEAGDQFFRKGDYEAASMNYVRAIELNPNYLDAWNNLSMALHKMGRLNDADYAMHIVRDLQGEGRSEKVSPEPAPPGEARHEKHPPDYSRLEREKKSPVLAAVVSFFFPGLGQITNGQNIKGFFILFGTIVGTALVIVPGLVIWLFGMYDAYTMAKRMKYGKIPFEPTNILFVLLYFVIFITIAVLLSAAILSILAGLEGATPLSLFNITYAAGNPAERYPALQLGNTT